MTPDANLLTSLYHLVAKGRVLESLLGKLPGFHPGVGEEGVVVGAFFGLKDSDYIAPHYRGALLAAHMRGADLRRLIAGVLGKVTSYSRGRVRGDICLPLQFNTLGMFSGVLGNPLNISTGIALAASLDEKQGVVVTSFGEGTSNLGAFHESLNLAACLALPIVYICQNNGYAMSTRTDYALKCTSIADRAQGYGMPGIRVEGNDVVAMHQAVQSAVARARAGEGPTLIDAVTYRISGHYSADPNDYQPKDERASWLKKDPLLLLKARLTAQGVMTDAQLAEIEKAAEAEITEAIAQAQADPDPGLEVLGPDDLYSPVLERVA
ncbi:thiamine pyrophosphate-dependent dehydrogenase E1 component subunit alpha [Aestuariivirga sp. YIM B02566]|uniref:Thiamine pyrophosphate-dependent dehydrogenase E1 component subunit alpha n=1 Tax=Taklimakanibacter albus TaxID=2800327 RepID=A0ACC5R940_9HYPH|nr:thiamine pyrophosphate-dependent dehydrogenase E1 component subunit alpha [Aestuariivirga sp. YIM B02566]MBK1869201.1 thiamine pyrophosphate-dependent dehydrogenase E1 component subunit alpha [Aestuariivirga sp. YIM B02566]